MTSLARYHGRSPRYILDTEDDNLVRIAGPKQIPWEEGTNILNVSLTGLSFTAPDDLCPLLGEVIRIQFNPPGAPQMACYGIVTRLENSTESKTLVGIHFYKMELAQRVSLAQGLSKKLKQAHDRGRLDTPLNNRTIKIGLSELPQILVLFILATFWSAIFYSIFHWNYTELFNFLLNSLK